MQSVYDSHLRRKEGARNAKEADKKHAKSDKNFVSFNFDKQANLTTPKLYGKQIFYKRKLNTYNETTYDVENKDGHCYVWNESEGGQGSNEVATCVYKNILRYQEAEHITMFSDTCGGENRNAQMSSMCMHTVQQMKNLKILEQKYFEPGHSEMEADSMHSTIQSKSKKAEIQMPHDWSTVMRLSRHTPAPYTVEEQTFSDFIDWKTYAKQRDWKNFTLNDKKERIQWLKIRQIRYKKDNPGTFEYKYTFSPEEEYQQVTVMPCRKSDRKSTPIPFEQKSLPKLYSGKQPISLAKKKRFVVLV